MGEERLQKLLAHAGQGSRRSCEELILRGRVTVDGKVVRELGTRVDPRKAVVAVDGQRIREERLVYFAVNKPKGYVSTSHDPAGKPKVVDLLPEIPQRVYTVGRLDEQSTGLMILTNDGELANKLAHPKFGVEKLYRVVVAGDPGRDVFNKLTEGIWLAEGKVRAKRVRPVARRGQATVLEMTLAEGKNREIRRMLAKLGHKVMSLTRIAVGPIGLKGLAVGACRPLAAREVELLARVASGEFVPFPERPDVRPREPRPTSKSSESSPKKQSIPEGPGRGPRSGNLERPPERSGRPHSAPPRQSAGRPPVGPNVGPRSPIQGRGPSGPGQGGPRTPYARPAQVGPPRPPAGGSRSPEPERGPLGPGEGPRTPYARPARGGPSGGPPAGARPPLQVQGGPARPPRGGARPASGPPPRPSAPPRPGPTSESPPKRRIIGLDLGPSARPQGPPHGRPGGPKGRRPTPRRAPRAALDVKRKPKSEKPAEDES
ncbi:MAG: pseudouridine synthase [Isosphaeraceae bacterium]